jgi:hypothetical protein
MIYFVVYICKTVKEHIYNAELVNVGTDPPKYFGADHPKIVVLDASIAETKDG